MDDILDLEKLRKLRKKMRSGSVREKIDLWIEMYEGSVQAAFKLAVISGLMTQQEYDKIDHEE